MAYHRRTILKTAALEWQTTELAAADDGWTEPYQPSEMRLVVPLTGAFLCRATHDSELRCAPTHGLRLDAGVRYRLRQPEAGQRSFVFVIRDQSPSEATPAVRAIRLSPALHLKLRLLSADVRRGVGEPLEIEELVFAELAGGDAARVSTIDAAGQGNHRAVRAVIAYLTDDPTRADTLTDIARAVHCSAFHLARLFRRATGTTLHAFRGELRMTAALDRLADGERDLAGLALDLGFGSQSHFNAAFKRTFATVPGEVRTKLLSPHRRT